MSLSSAIAQLFGNTSPAPNAGSPGFAFAIPIAAYVDDAQWASLSDLLVGTIRSVIGQTNPNFKVYVAGHERPERLDEFDDSRLEFISVAFGRPGTPRQKRQDKRRKRWAIAARFRESGGGYFMYLDADDYVHRELVQYVLSDDNRTGYFIPEGYALDYRSRNIAPVPGAWRKPLHKVCGSTGIIYFEAKDLPKRPYPRQLFQTARYFKIRSHQSFETVALHGRPNEPIPFPAVIYNVNNALNLSNVIVRTEERQQQLIESIRKRDIPDKTRLFDEFSLEG